MKFLPFQVRLAGLALPLLAVGCAAPADHPSLAPRPIEKVMTQPESSQIIGETPAPAPDSRIAPQLAAARDADAKFGNQLDVTRAAVNAARGAAAGSDAWVEAQQAISRLDALRAGVTGALAELDGMVLAGVRDPALAPAQAEVDMVDARERADLADLRSRLSGF